MEKRFRLLRALAYLALGIALGHWIFPKGADVDGQRQLQSISAGPSLVQIQSLARLTTVHVEVADALVTSLNGQLGGVSVAMVVRGGFTIDTDLQQARFEIADRQQRVAVLHLPPPRRSEPRLDHRRSRIFGFEEHGLWLLTPEGNVYTRVSNEAWAQAELIIAGAADDPEIIGRAKQQTQAVLDVFFQQLGWTVRIQWLDSGPTLRASTAD